ncbi:uncharacterized protein LOC127845738 isoform X2 [Dreissena polymorpha]|uniref:uncharacterized protein LOC127845738 isoform X2 n=1 Tax=Dreissena polymorpha TaxID=45954 RepID=UPI002264E86D|nr:uncharacterized protein LOC127845738 isoform X2 [Dreissena polymorpha]
MAYNANRYQPDRGRAVHRPTNRHGADKPSVLGSHPSTTGIPPSQPTHSAVRHEPRSGAHASQSRTASLGLQTPLTHRSQPSHSRVKSGGGSSARDSACYTNYRDTAYTDRDYVGQRDHRARPSATSVKSSVAKRVNKNHTDYWYNDNGRDQAGYGNYGDTDYGHEDYGRHDSYVDAANVLDDNLVEDYGQDEHGNYHDFKTAFYGNASVEDQDVEAEQAWEDAGEEQLGHGAADNKWVTERLEIDGTFAEASPAKHKATRIRQFSATGHDSVHRDHKAWQGKKHLQVKTFRQLDQELSHPSSDHPIQTHRKSHSRESVFDAALQVSNHVNQVYRRTPLSQEASPLPTYVPGLNRSSEVTQRHVSQHAQEKTLVTSQRPESKSYVVESTLFSANKKGLLPDPTNLNPMPLPLKKKMDLPDPTKVNPMLSKSSQKDYRHNHSTVKSPLLPTPIVKKATIPPAMDNLRKMSISHTDVIEINSDNEVTVVKGYNENTSNKDSLKHMNQAREFQCTKNQYGKKVDKLSCQSHDVSTFASLKPKCSEEYSHTGDEQIKEKSKFVKEHTPNSNVLLISTQVEKDVFEYSHKRQHKVLVRKPSIDNMNANSNVKEGRGVINKKPNDVCSIYESKLPVVVEYGHGSAAGILSNNVLHGSDKQPKIFSQHTPLICDVGLKMNCSNKELDVSLRSVSTPVSEFNSKAVDDEAKKRQLELNAALLALQETIQKVGQALKINKVPEVNSSPASDNKSFDNILSQKSSTLTINGKEDYIEKVDKEDNAMSLIEDSEMDNGPGEHEDEICVTNKVDMASNSAVNDTAALETNGRQGKPVTDKTNCMSQEITPVDTTKPISLKRQTSNESVGMAEMTCTETKQTANVAENINFDSHNVNDTNKSSDGKIEYKTYKEWKTAKMAQEAKVKGSSSVENERNQETRSKGVESVRENGGSSKSFPKYHREEMVSSRAATDASKYSHSKSNDHRRETERRVDHERRKKSYDDIRDHSLSGRRRESQEHERDHRRQNKRNDGDASKKAESSVLKRDINPEEGCDSRKTNQTNQASHKPVRHFSNFLDELRDSQSAEEHSDTRSSIKVNESNLVKKEAVVGEQFIQTLVAKRGAYASYLSDESSSAEKSTLSIADKSTVIKAENISHVKSGNENIQFKETKIIVEKHSDESIKHDSKQDLNEKETNIKGDINVRDRKDRKSSSEGKLHTKNSGKGDKHEKYKIGEKEESNQTDLPLSKPTKKIARDVNSSPCGQIKKQCSLNLGKEKATTDPVRNDKKDNVGSNMKLESSVDPSTPERVFDSDSSLNDFDLKTSIPLSKQWNRCISKSEGQIKTENRSDIAKKLVVKLVDLKDNQQFKDKLFFFDKCISNTKHEQLLSAQNVNNTADLNSQKGHELKQHDERNVRHSQISAHKFVEHKENDKTRKHDKSKDGNKVYELEEKETHDKGLNIVVKHATEIEMTDKSDKTIRYSDSNNSRKRQKSSSESKSSSSSLKKNQSSYLSESQKHQQKGKEKDTGSKESKKIDEDQMRSITQKKGEVNERNMFSSDSDDDSQSSIFAKINSFLNRDRRKLLLKKTTQKDRKPYTSEISLKASNIFQSDDNVSETSSSDIEVDSKKFNKESPKLHSVKHLKRINDKTVWKGTVLKFPNIKIENLNENSMKELSKKLRKGENSVSKKNINKSLEEDKSSDVLNSDFEINIVEESDHSDEVNILVDAQSNSSKHVSTSSEISFISSPEISMFTGSEIDCTDRNVFEMLGLPETTVDVYQDENANLQCYTAVPNTTENESATAPANSGKTGLNNAATFKVCIQTIANRDTFDMQGRKTKTNKTSKTLSETNLVSLPSISNNAINSGDKLKTINMADNFRNSDADVIITKPQLNRVDSNATTMSETSVSTVDDAGYVEIDNGSSVEMGLEYNIEEQDETVLGALENALCEHFEMEDEELEYDSNQNMVEHTGDSYTLNETIKDSSFVSDGSSNEYQNSTSIVGCKEELQIASTHNSTENNCPNGISCDDNNKMNVPLTRKNIFKKNDDKNSQHENNPEEILISADFGEVKRSNTCTTLHSDIDAIMGESSSILLDESGDEGDIEDNVPILNLVVPLSDDEDFSQSQDLFADIEKHFDKDIEKHVDKDIKTSKDDIKGKQSSADLSKTELQTQNDDCPNQKEDGNPLEQGIAGYPTRIINDNVEFHAGNNTPETDQNMHEFAEGQFDIEVKDEPVWLKFGYTQEPDTIFLSDTDDDLIMSISQPVINLVSSDEESHNGTRSTKNATESQGFVVKVKQEKDGLSGDSQTRKTYGENDVENFSDDWSDEGSDFDPDDIFNPSQSLLYTSKITDDDNESNISSDEDIFLSQVPKESAVYKQELKTEEPCLDMHNYDSDEKNDFESEDDDFLVDALMSVQQKKVINAAVGMKDITDGEKLKVFTKKEYNKTIILDESNAQIDGDEISDNEMPVFDYHSEHFFQSDTIKSCDENESSGVHINEVNRTTAENKYDKNINSGEITSTLTNQNIDDITDLSRWKEIVQEEVNKNKISSTCTKDHELSDIELSDYEFDDPQKAAYIQDTQVETKRRFLSGNIELSFSSFSDEENKDLYSETTQVIPETLSGKDNYAVDHFYVQTQVDSSWKGKKYSNRLKPFTDTDENTFNAEKYCSQIKTDSLKENNAYEISTQINKHLDVSHNISTGIDLRKQDLKKAYNTPTLMDDLVFTSDEDSRGSAGSKQSDRTTNSSKKKNVEKGYNTQTQIDDLVLSSDENHRESDASKPGKLTVSNLATGGKYVTATQVKNTSDNDDDPYSAATQIDVTEHDLLDEDNDEKYFNATQIDSDGDTIKVDKRDHYDERYFDATQIDSGEDENTMNDNNYYTYGMETQVINISDSNSESSADGWVETQLDDDLDLDDLPDVGDGMNPYQIATQAVTMEAVIDKQVEPTSDVAPSASQLKRSRSEIQSESSEQSTATAKKPRLSLSSKRSVCFTEPQKIKSIAEKWASGVLVGKSGNSLNSTSTSGTAKTIEGNYVTMLDATKASMWLSKKVISTKEGFKIGKGKAGRKKRGESVEDKLKAKMAEARSQLKERNMHTKVNPGIIPDKHRHREIPSTATDVDDVNLPTCSQIVEKGLPILNSTGLLTRKRHASEVLSSSDLCTNTRTATADISIASTTISSVPIATTSVVSLPRTTVSDTVPKPKISGADFMIGIPDQQRAHELTSFGKNKDDKSAVKRKDSTESHEKENSTEVKTKRVRFESEDPKKHETVGRQRHKTDSHIRVSGSQNFKENRVKSVSTSTDIQVPTTKTSQDLQVPSVPISNDSAITSSITSTNIQMPYRLISNDISRVSSAFRSGAVTNATSVPSVPTDRPRSRPQISHSTSTHVPSELLLKKSSYVQPAAMPPSSVANYNINSSSDCHVISSTGQPQGRQPFQPLQQSTTHIATFSSTNRVMMPLNMVDKNLMLHWDDFLKDILRWNPEWFDEKLKFENDGKSKRVAAPPVTSSNQALFPLLRRYQSYKEYTVDFMLPLLLHETWETCYNDWREKNDKKARHQMMFSHSEPHRVKAIAVYILHGLISETECFRGNYINDGDLVKLVVNGKMELENGVKNLTYKMTGYLEKVTFRNISVEKLCAHNADMAKLRPSNAISMTMHILIRLRKFCPDEKHLITLERISPLVNTRRQFTALSCLSRNPLCPHLLFPTGNTTYCDLAPPSIAGVHDKYNTSQSRAINTVEKISKLPDNLARVVLLQGPPGTGKSHTIIGVIKRIVQSSKGGARICLCAPSHSAVDELLRRLVRLNKEGSQSGSCDPIRIIRLGKHCSPDIKDLLLDTQVNKAIHKELVEQRLSQLPASIQGERHTLDTKIGTLKKQLAAKQDQMQKMKLKNDLKKLEKEKHVIDSKCAIDTSKTPIDPRKEREVRHRLIMGAHVVAGTLSSMGSQAVKSLFSVHAGQDKLAFTCIIVDEATQAIELDTLIPLQYGSTKLVLVGDPEQLPPTVLSQTALDMKFNMSLFERLDGHFKDKDSSPVILLDVQYRMDPEIAFFPNQYIYTGRIRNDKCVMDRSTFPLVPYLLFNILEGKELFSQHSRSMSNQMEAEFVAELCRCIVHSKCKVTEKMIGIIAPYSKQRDEISDKLKHRRLETIEVCTVDGFQGREKHVIIMSCVRANLGKNVGFVGCRKRMNVALTRAKYAMYIVGHFQSLEGNDEWNAMVTDARNRNKIVAVEESSLATALKSCFKLAS